MKKDLNERIFDFCSEKNDHHIVLIDGIENAFVGVVRRGNVVAACYDYEKSVTILRGDNEMTSAEAEEFIEYNIDKNWVGKNTPFFIKPFTS
jgi:hypothetical protein